MNKPQNRLGRIDWFVVGLLLSVLVATVLPCQGSTARLFEYLTVIAIVVLFFMHGAKLSREAIVQGIINWRLHLITLLVTFVLFPCLGMMMQILPWIDAGLIAGLVYLTLLPSTVQSSIAFTSIAKGNVAAAVCAATLSNLLGMVLTPLLAATLMNTASHGPVLSMSAIGKIGLQLLLPFVIGHLMRPWIGTWIERHKRWIGRTDRSSILLIVYTTFSASVMDGLWSKCSMLDLAGVTVASAVLLWIVLILTWWLGQRAGFSREDAIVLFFCGSKKSLASGVPIAGVLFLPGQVGMILIPVMIFHQFQLIVCAYIARRMGASP